MRMRGSNTVAAWLTAFFLWELMGEMGGMGGMGVMGIKPFGWWGSNTVAAWLTAFFLWELMGIDERDGS